MSQNPSVSLIVRTKDRPKLLKDALRSIAGQVYRPIEVVLVNDGGCDLDISEIKNILGDVSLIYIRLGKNTGRANAGNAGIEHARGDYIGFLDDDDDLCPDHVSTLIGFLNQSEYKVVYSDAFFVFKEYDTEACEFKGRRKELAFSRDFDYDLLVFENYIPFMCLLFSRDVFLDLHGLDVTLDLYEDWDALIRIGEKYPFHHIKRTTAYYNQWSSDFQISQDNRNQKYLEQSYMRVISKHLDKITPERIRRYMSRHVYTRNLVKEKESLVVNLSAEIERKDAALRESNSRKDMLSSEIRELQALLHESNALIHAMRDTLGWRVLERYRRLRNRILSTPSARRVKDSLFAKGLSVFKNQGFKATLRKANKKLLFNKSVKRASIPIEIPPPPSYVVQETEGNPLLSRVSVLIPTKNAGEEFDYVLRKITQQEGIGEIELIIVDSGSEDSTVKIAREYTDNVFQIASGDFHHAGTRNFAAEKASGEFLVFTVQDAVPVSTQWLFKLLSPIHQGKASAVSARQIPRSDADLFSCWSYWSHNIKYLGCDHDSLSNNSLFDDFDALDLQSKRSLAKLDSVSLGIRKAVFDEYKYISEYAEDFDLGIRLIHDNHTLLFQSSNAVIHSHNRPALYFLKRSYTDTTALWNLLHMKRRANPPDAILEALSFAYSGLKICLSPLLQEDWRMRNPSDAVSTVIDCLAHRIHGIHAIAQPPEGDQMVDEFFKPIPPVYHKKMISEFYTEVQAVSRSFADFTSRYSSVHEIETDLVQSIYKLFCLTAGHYLAANSVDQVHSLQRGV
ncbi:MAG: glycosyltransferase [Thermodesulfovibrionales bacterium]|nr:glycosyltransferase [Thermodesulfovibrionales bacterium]